MATATTAKPSLSYFLNNPCHNCRRRRLRCDRSRPSCNKCSSSGRECLGYDKLFVWTPCAGTGIAARAAAGTPTPPAVTTLGAAAAPTAAGGGRAAEAKQGSSTGRCSSQAETLSTTGSASSSLGTLRGAGSFSVVPFTGASAHARRHVASARHPKNIGAASTEGEVEMTGTATICAPATLTDPLFKDLDLVSRRYLSHCWYQFSHVSPLSVPLSPSLQASWLPNLTQIHKFNKLDIELDPANERLFSSYPLKSR